MYFLTLSGTLNAASTVAVLLSEPGGHYQEYMDALALALTHNTNRQLRVIELPAGHSRPDEVTLNGVSLIIAVGVQAMRNAVAWEGVPAVLNVLVPRARHERLLAENGNSRRRSQFSAIYLDQPPARQINLMRLVLPGKRRISVLLGPDSALLLAPLRAAVQRSGLELVVEEVASEPEIIPALSRLMNASDAFLALPDSIVFTRDTVRSVLMSAFRYQRPLIGFSAAYVTSGALAATFSTPEQIARQTAELLNNLPPGRVNLPAPRYPEYFSVTVNRSVARALHLDIPSDGSLLETLTSLPES